MHIIQHAPPVDPRLEELRTQWEKELREKIAAERASRDAAEPTHAEKERSLFRSRWGSADRSRFDRI
jgi:hypothetical protein